MLYVYKLIVISASMEYWEWDLGMRSIPSMYDNWFVASSPLSHAHLVDDMNEGLWIGAQTLSTPLIHLKLSHLLNLTRLYHNE